MSLALRRQNSPHNRHDVIEELSEPIIGSNAGAWVVRATGQIDLVVTILIRGGSNNEDVGIREAGSTRPDTFGVDTDSVFTMPCKTNLNGEIEIFSTHISNEFTIISAEP